MRNKRRKLLDIYNKLHGCFGPQHWWPGETRFEIIIGAILTQNVSWKNVEKAITNLKNKKLLSYQALSKAKEKEIAELIRPSGYYNQKAIKLKNFLRFAQKEYNGNLSKMKGKGITKLREKLLSVNGIGKETADSIILYAFNKPIFVVDAYTKRIFERLGFFSKNLDYDEVQNFFMKNLPKKTSLYNDYHAQIVNLGKDYCKNKKPNCSKCPLQKFCEYKSTVHCQQSTAVDG